MIWCRNYGVRTRLSAKSPTSAYRIRSHAGENERKFLEIRCWRVKNYSWEKSILLNDGGKVKKTNEQTNKQTELFNLSNKIIQTSRCRPPCIKRETLKMHDLLPLLIIFQAKFFFWPDEWFPLFALVYTPWSKYRSSPKFIFDSGVPFNTRVAGFSELVQNFPYVLHNIVAVMYHVPAFIKKRGVKMDK